MSVPSDLVSQHLSEHEELIAPEILKEHDRIGREERGKPDQITQYLRLYGVSLPEGMNIQGAWSVISGFRSNITRAIEGEKRGLVPGVKVQWDKDEVRVIRSVAKDYSIRLEDEPGAFHPLSLTLAD